MEEATTERPIQVFLQISSIPPTFDLSGDHFFDLCLQVRRGRSGDDNPSPLTFLTTESVFDIPYAFKHGFFELIDKDNETKVDLTACNVSNSSSARESESKVSFLTLRSKVVEPRHGPNDYDHTIPLRIYDYLKPFV